MWSGELFGFQPAVLKRVVLVAAALMVVAGTFSATAQETQAESESAELPTIPVTPIPEESKSEKDATVLEPITVTGSHIKRSDFETAQPITVITRVDIERSGMITIGDLLHELAAAGMGHGRLNNNGGRGTSEMDLRNMGSQRVLVMVDGHRWVRSVDPDNAGAVDLNTIPATIVERIEVLKDGASAIYGSEAITGVVNIITRKNYTGSKLTSYVGQYLGYGDGLTQSHHLSYGTLAGATSAFFDLSFVQQQSISANDRDISKSPRFGTGPTRGLTTTPRGFLLFIPNSANGELLGEQLCPTVVGADTAARSAGEDFPFPNGVQACRMTLIEGQGITGDPSETTATVASRYEPFNAKSLDSAVNDLYNYASSNHLATPVTLGSLFGQISHPVSGSIDLDTRLLYNTSHTDIQLAETATFNFGDLFPSPLREVYIDARQAFNPFDQDIGRRVEQGQPSDVFSPVPGPGSGYVQRRIVEAGPRVLKRDKATWIINPALSGNTDLYRRPVSWGAGALYARSEAKYFYTDDVRLDHLKLALGAPEACAVEPDCVPLNLFGAPGAITKEMLDYITYDSHNSHGATLQNMYFSSSTRLDDFGVFASPLAAAFGAEYRDENIDEHNDSSAVNGFNSSTFHIREATEGGYAVSEAFLELEAPLLRGRFMADTLGLNLAARYTKYEIFGGEVTRKIGLRWKPIPDLLFRGTASEAFRGPSPSDLYAGHAAYYGGPQTDPCMSELGAARDPGTVDTQNCNADGVPDPIPPQAGHTVLTGGNPEVKPETGYSLTAGFVYSPEYAAGLNVYTDWFRFRIENFIEYLDSNYILITCYFVPRPEGSRPKTCDYIQRRADGTLEYVRELAYNFAYVETDGLDFAFDYALPVSTWSRALGAIGALKLRFDSTYLNRFDRAIPDYDGIPINTGYAGLNRGDVIFPRFKANTALIWNRGAWDAAWSVHYVGSTTERCFDVNPTRTGPPTLRELGVCSDPDSDLSDGVDNSTNRLSAIHYHDLQIGHIMPDDGYRFVLGVHNLFNRDPPPSYTGSSTNFPPGGGYRIPGVHAYLRLQKTF